MKQSNATMSTNTPSVPKPENCATYEAKSSDYSGGTLKTGTYIGSEKLPESAPKDYSDHMATAPSEKASGMMNGKGKAAMAQTTPSADLNSGYSDPMARHG